MIKSVSLSFWDIETQISQSKTWRMTSWVHFYFEIFKHLRLIESRTWIKVNQWLKKVKGLNWTKEETLEQQTTKSSQQFHQWFQSMKRRRFSMKIQMKSHSLRQKKLSRMTNHTKCKSNQLYQKSMKLKKICIKTELW